VIDQYQVKGESDPNREDDLGYIVRLVGQVVRVSMESGTSRSSSDARMSRRMGMTLMF
jgi:hypothetical protein